MNLSGIPRHADHLIAQWPDGATSRFHYVWLRDVFDPNSGPRHLQGCYVDLDDFLSRIRVLERRLAASSS